MDIIMYMRRSKGNAMKRISASDVKNHWGDFVKAVTEGEEAVIVENRREPLFMAIRPDDFADFEAYLKERRLRQARETLKQIDRIQAGRNDDLSDEEIEEIGIQTAREIRDDLDRALYGRSIPSH